MGLTTKWNERGSEWNRWDPHIHAPGTVLNDQFNNDWESYLKKIEASIPRIRALGVTDYCCISTYRDVRTKWQEGRLPDVDLIFPNVEFRLDVQTERKKAINLHLIFSPEDSDHEEQIERILGQLNCDIDGQLYNCTQSGLAALGRKHNPKQKDDYAAFREGVNQFKISFKDIKKLFKDESWIRQNCLIGISAAEGDGTSGLKSDGSFTVVRTDMEGSAHIVFSSKQVDREFWLGKKALSAEQIQNKYHFLKPCLHGCDAHDIKRVAEPDEKRYCWIKGDLHFETLRQAVIEPEERVWIGEEPPPRNLDSVTISKIIPAGTTWLKKDSFELNNGLVSVIGARGSGKTALIDLIAAGAFALPNELDKSSFLRRATEDGDLIGPDATVTEEWADGESVEVRFRPPAELWEDHSPLICYLSQHFVNRLCGESGIAKELIEEIERVIFEQTDKTKRFETNSFKDLSEHLLDRIVRMRQTHIDDIHSHSEQIAEEEKQKEQLPKLGKQRKELTDKLNKALNEVGKILKKGKEDRAKLLVQLEAEVTAVESKIEAVSVRQQSLNDLLQDVNYIASIGEPQRLLDMMEQHSKAGLTADEWKEFEMEFKGEVKTIIANAKKAADREAEIVQNGDPENPIDFEKIPSKDWPLTPLKAHRDNVKKEVGIDDDAQRKYGTLQKAITADQASLRTINENITHAEDADARKKDLRQKRRDAYKAVFECFDQERQNLETLYEPLKKEIKTTGDDTLGKLRFIVRREVKFEDWINAGEDLIDLRKFRAVGELKQEAAKLSVAWKTKGPEEISQAMNDFLGKMWDHILASKLPSIKPEEKAEWMKNVGDWLYGTDHISMRYALEYDGVEIERLSPGTRGIVLLLLYLAIDKTDRRPLVIDQPEENLDPKSVFRDLVPHFREARKRRQIIIVTHNANLVVNTDADQIIVASSKPAETGRLPEISYECGSIENPSIRQKVCEILEGGKRAFLDRERRYRFEWEKLSDEEPER